MAARLVVTTARGGSRITLVGASGTELLTSKVFTEPRAKGATLRSLKSLLGEDIVVDDNTVTTVTAARKTVAATRPTAVSSRSTVKRAVDSTPTRRKKAAAK